MKEVQVLLRGCRCIEVDVWDGEPQSPDFDTHSQGSAKDEGNGRFKSYLRRALSPGRKPEKSVAFPPAGPGLKDEVSLQLPERWKSYSSLSRAEPRVLHGYTLTKEVSFREVCVAIRDAAFVTRYRNVYKA